MRRISSFLLWALALAVVAPVLVLLGPAHIAAGQDAKKEKAKADSPLDGAWKLVSAKDPRNGQMRKLPAGIEMTKLIVGGRYVWTVVQADKVVAGAGGSYKVKDDEYTESVAFVLGANQQPMAGKSFTFSWKIEDGKWRHKGTLKVGNTQQEIDEIWERVPSTSD
jgi:hypothetical protein